MTVRDDDRAYITSHETPQEPDQCLQNCAQSLEHNREACTVSPIQPALGTQTEFSPPLSGAPSIASPSVPPPRPCCDLWSIEFWRANVAWSARRPKLFLPCGLWCRINPRPFPFFLGFVWSIHTRMVWHPRLQPYPPPQRLCEKLQASHEKLQESSKNINHPWDS